MGASSFALLLTIALFCFRISLQQPNDVTTLRLLQSQWGNTPGLNWTGVDPCGSKWIGVSCMGTRLANLLLPAMNLKGGLPPEIGQLTGLERLDLSYNPGLSGPIPQNLGSLKNLRELILLGCSFTGRIPPDLGNLGKLTRLDLNSNNLGGNIPAELGNLTNLYWFDVANNQLDGPLPVELQKLVKAGHFHFSKNYLNGLIPPQIFHENMTLLHVLFDHNNFIGEIPSTLGLLSKITVLRLDRNQLEGPIPPEIANLTSLSEVHISSNKLNGAIPDLSALTNLQYLDLSNNSFDLSQFPDWFSKLELITTIVMESTNLNGPFPSHVFHLQQLETLRVARNQINGELVIESVSRALQLADFELNKITTAFVGPAARSVTINLKRNPACAAGSSLSEDRVCNSVTAVKKPYFTPVKDCANINCGDLMKVDPRICECAMPYEGVFLFRSPGFSNLRAPSRFQNLEKSLVVNLTLTEGSVYILCCMAFDASDYLNMTVQIFPPRGKKYFEPTDIVQIGNSLSSQTYKPPKEFGPYYFIPNSDDLFLDLSKGSKGLSAGVVIGIGVGAAVVVLIILGLGFYALKQKRKVEKAAKTSRPYGSSWGFGSGEYSGDAPKLKGARWFSFEELKQATNNFSTANEIGSGGYGKVYKGMLAVGAQMVAVKRAANESMQGGVEFKTEIELLSRVHHKNLVGLIGFCFEEGENMLVYEYMPNGSLRDNLFARTGIKLDWRKRIRIALGAARGLSYLHEHANPPIIHRDVKSSNILLDESLNSKVADFGLSKLITPIGTGAGEHIESQVKGTMGYLDPEYFMTQQLSQKSDVYSFGVVLLEILTARQPIERGKYLVREVRTVTDRGGINALVRHELLDSVIRDAGVTVAGFEKFVSLALRCSEDSVTNRPKMSEVVKELEGIAEDLEGNKGNEESEMESWNRIKGVGSPLYRGEFSDSFDNSGRYIMPPVEPK